jgi:DNA-damage-inducible protein J
MTTATINARIDADLKRDAEHIFSQIGLSTSQAIRLFYKQTILEKGLPFQPVYNLPPETVEAIREAEEGRLEEVTLDELKAELDAIH